MNLNAPDAIRIFSFFSGAGFLDLGFEFQGHFRIAFANEFHERFCEIYRGARASMGLPPPIYGFNAGDASSLLQPGKEGGLERLLAIVRDSKEKSLTGFIGGPPCPDFSVAGKNRGVSGRNGRLTSVYAELILAALPDFFVFENVKGLYRTARHRAFFEDLKRRLMQGGYSLAERLCNALEFGVPQDRDRIILVGFSNEAIRKLGLTSAGGRLCGFPWGAGIRHGLAQVKSLPWPKTDKYQENGRLPKPPGIIEELTVEWWFRRNRVSTHSNAGMCFRPRAGLAAFQSRDEGDCRGKSYKRLHRWRYSPTAAYGNNEVHIHPYLPRRISVAEALAIQSLPESFAIPEGIPLSDAFKAVGNGVPYLMARGIAGSIWRFVSGSLDWAGSPRRTRQDGVLRAQNEGC